MQKVDGADWNEEIGCITELVLKRKKEPPALLFDNIKDYPPGYRLLTSVATSVARTALILGLPTHYSLSELSDALVEKLAVWEGNLDRYAPEIVREGPILENVQSGKEVDLFRFPAPKWHWKDGGRYIGTGDAVITRDPDTGEVNVGTYRVQIHDEKTLGFYVSPGHHARIHREKFYARGEPCPVAISLGHHPLLLRIASLSVPAGGEYQYLGAYAGEPLKVIREGITGLPIPADSEIVVAGWSPPDEERSEGPFGEWTGYYASKERPTPVIRVERIYHRMDPILLGVLTERPPGDTGYVGPLVESALLHRDLVRMGVPDVKRVWLSEWGFQTFVVISIKQRYTGHAKQAALAAIGGSRVTAYHGRYVIIVDDDIDPTDLGQVVWALGTRSDPEKSIDIVRRAWSTPLDPMIRKPADAFFNSRAVIDACRPFEWMQDFPEVIESNPETLRRTEAKWKSLLDG